MDVDEFNDNYINLLLDKLSKQIQSVFLLGDFNVNLLKFEKHALANEFLDSLSPHMFLPYIVQPTRISTTCKTLIDNIFSNTHTLSFILGKLYKFLIVPDFLKISSPPRFYIYERDWSNFDQENFILD